jgi:hypothetical protein
MSSTLFTTPRSREFTPSGTVLSGAKLYFVVSGTSTPSPVYYDSALTTPHADPVVADTGGLFPAIWLDSSVSYDVTLKNSAGVEQWTEFEYSEVLTIDQLGAVLFPRTAAEIAAGVTPVSYAYQALDIRRYGAVNGTDVTDAAHTALSVLGSTGGVIDFPARWNCYIRRSAGANDKWGIKVTGSKVTLRGNGAKLLRYNADISTYSLAYPLVLVGTPDNNAAAATEHVTIEGFVFEGNDTRHATPGNALTDFRDAIVFKNSAHTTVEGCTFTKIDSAAITYQKPVTYDYVHSVSYNTTKNYDAKITNCKFLATAHATSGRALIHAINCDGVDGIAIDSGNRFEYCDSCFSGETSYDGPLTFEANTYTPTVAGWSLGPVKRSGRGWKFNNNYCYNSSEIPAYPAGVDVEVDGNTFLCDSPSFVADSAVKVRSRLCSVTRNTIIGYPTAVTVSAPAYSVTVTGNPTTLSSTADSEGGAFDINAEGLSAYVAARADYMTHHPMSGIVIANNPTEFPTTAATDTNRQSFVRIRTDNAADANYPEGQIQGPIVRGNQVRNYNVGVYVVGPNLVGALVQGNFFFAKPFVSAGFTGATTVNTRAVIQANVGLGAAQLRQIKFEHNYIHGATYLFATTTGAGAAGTFETPWGCSQNRFNYIKNIKTADVAVFSVWNNFRNNQGVEFLDRTWNGEALENSLADDAGSANSQRRYTTAFIGAEMRFYTNDTGTYVDLAL